MGISLGDFHRTVAQKLAHGIQVNAAHYQIACKTVPEVVEPEILYPCPSFCSLSGPVYIAEGLTLLIAEDIFRVRFLYTKSQKICQLRI